MCPSRFLLPKAYNAITAWGGISSCRELLGFNLTVPNPTHLQADVNREELGFVIQPDKRKEKKMQKQPKGGIKTTPGPAGLQPGWGKGGSGSH